MTNTLVGQIRFKNTKLGPNYMYNAKQFPWRVKKMQLIIIFEYIEFVNGYSGVCLPGGKERTETYRTTFSIRFFFYISLMYTIWIFFS